MIGNISRQQSDEGEDCLAVFDVTFQTACSARLCNSVGSSAVRYVVGNHQRQKTTRWGASYSATV